MAAFAGGSAVAQRARHAAPAHSADPGGAAGRRRHRQVLAFYSVFMFVGGASFCQARLALPCPSCDTAIPPYGNRLPNNLFQW
jgi:hypothetical protein